MADEVKGTASGATGGTLPSAPVTPQPPPAQPPAPQYLTREDALALEARLKQSEERAAQLDAQLRGLQSVVDRSGISKQALKKRLGPVEQFTQRLKQDGILDESQASTYLGDETARALVDILPDEEPPVGGQPSVQLDPVQQKAQTMLDQSGLLPTDPEYQTLFGHTDPFSWYQALESAKTTKAARLLREKAGQPPSSPTAAIPPVTPVPVEVGVGGGVPLDRAVLPKQLNEAARRGDRARVEEIKKLLASSRPG